jgi:type I restriction enzyme R subunit
VHYTEDTLVQQTTADYLEQQLGWESVYAYNNEDFGPDSLLGRASDREVVLTRPLREKLVSLNPGLPDAAYDDAVRQITATVASADTRYYQPGEVRPDARRGAGHLPQPPGRAGATAAERVRLRCAGQ